jgi:phospholipid/cholesterol/gamma-HCH transport system ATP-binding protein
VFFDGQDISDLSEADLVEVRRRIGFCFQGGALFDSMTVEQNICFPLGEHRVGSRQSQRQRCEQVLQLVGLDGLQPRMPVELSGGQQKRIALARAIVLNPDVVLYDEPTTGLDPVRADLINELILRLQAELQNTAVVVTHDMTSARKLADRIIMLHEGRILCDSTPDELDGVDNAIVQRFIRGQASPDELARLKSGGLATMIATTETKP